MKLILLNSLSHFFNLFWFLSFQAPPSRAVHGTAPSSLNGPLIFDTQRVITNSSAPSTVTNSTASSSAFLSPSPDSPASNSSIPSKSPSATTAPPQSPASISSVPASVTFLNSTVPQSPARISSVPASVSPANSTSPQSSAKISSVPASVTSVNSTPPNYNLARNPSVAPISLKINGTNSSVVPISPKLNGTNSSVKIASPKPTTLVRDPSAKLKAICHIKPLSPESWTKLNLDSYLKNYPSGSNLTLSQFAASKGLPNFQCGLRGSCSAGQPCYPILPPDWYIFFALEQWNIKLNSMKVAISFAMGFVKATIAGVIAALIPAFDLTAVDNLKLSYGVNGAVTMCSNTVLLDIFCFFNSFQDTTGDVVNIINNVMGAGFALKGGLLPSPEQPEGKLEGFASWAHLQSQMSKYENLLTSKLEDEMGKVQAAGISTNQGIYGQLKNGTFLKPSAPLFLPRLEDDIKNATLAIAVVKVLRSLDAFVTIGQEVCNQNGPNGALSEEGTLSYCDNKGTMYNIIRVKKDKEVRKFYNSWALQERFGYSTQLLTNLSWSCQQKYGGFEAFPYKNYTVPRNMLSDCIVNLPVCDCRDNKIKKDIKKHGVVVACRKAGLPI